MKTTTTLSAPAPDEGGNNGGAHGAASLKPGASKMRRNGRVILTPEEILTQAAKGQRSILTATAEPEVTEVGEPVLPLAEGAKVKMGLSHMNNAMMVPYIQNHIEMMTGNALYATPLPPAVDFLAQFTAYHNAVQAADAAETIYRNAVAIRDAERLAMVNMMNQRGGYVQTASNGNRQAIVSSGLGVKNPPTPVTFLAAPWNLRVDLNGEAGMVKIRWNAVYEAKNYVLQCSPDVTPRVWTQIASTGKCLVTMNLEIGQTYVFRVAAQGKPGQSNWSAEYIRGVA